MKKELSKLFTLNLWDLTKAAILFFLASLGDLVYQFCAAWLTNHATHFDILMMLRVAGVGTVMYLLKQFLTGNKTPLQNFPAQPDKIKE